MITCTATGRNILRGATSFLPRLYVVMGVEEWTEGTKCGVTEWMERNALEMVWMQW